METPPTITFRNMEPSTIDREWIQAEIGKLENFYHPIIACRVALGMPHRHHRNGAQCHVRIDLVLPGEEIVIKRQPNSRSRALRGGKAEITKILETGTPHNDLRLAIDDAFRAAGRRLQDLARRQSKQVKTHAAAPLARVSRILGDEGYGFLTTPEGREIYFHKDSVLNRGFGRLTAGTLVNFAEEAGEKGPQASTVKIAAKQGRRAAIRAAGGAL